jgi:mRNA interferase MazF
VSPDELNSHLETVIVVPLTSTIKEWPFRLNINYAGKSGSMAFDQIRAISKSRILKKTSKISKTAQEDILNILQAMFGE